MSFNKKFFTTGGIVASTSSAPAAFDPLQNFETVTYTGNGSTQKITGYIRKGAAFNSSSSSSINTNFINNLSAASFSFWIKVPSSQSTLSTRLLSSVSTNPLKAGQWSFIYNGSGSVSFQLVTNGGSITNLSNVSFSLDTWQHFVFTYDNSTNI